MKRNRLMQVSMLVISVLLIGGAVLVSWLMITEEDRNVMKVNLDSGETKVIKFDHLGLIPGESCEYTISLSGDRVKTYDVHLNFEEAAEAEGKTLKNFARVTVLANEKTICDELLVTAFEKEDITFSVDFEQEKQVELTVKFYLPLEVGNEAKNAEAMFELQITSGNE